MDEKQSSDSEIKAPNSGDWVRKLNPSLVEHNAFKSILSNLIEPTNEFSQMQTDSLVVQNASVCS